MASWITILSLQSIHREGDLQVYIGVKLRETRHHTEAHVTSGAIIHSGVFLAARGTHMAAELTQ